MHPKPRRPRKASHRPPFRAGRPDRRDLHDPISIPRAPLAPLAGAALLALCTAAGASSHREAPFITTAPKVDATDFYMFRSYETGRGDYVTLIANYLPLQDAYGGPNYFTLDPNALYEIHIDNNGDAREDLTLPVPLQEHARNGRASR